MITALELATKLQEQQDVRQRFSDQIFERMNDGQFIAIALNDSEYVLAPYPEITTHIYRGQKCYYDPCQPSLHRCEPNQIERFIATLRLAEFQLLIAEHPAIVDFTSWTIMGLRPRVDYEGIAQHYGLQTELLDFTTNPFVAAFFACTTYDNRSDKFTPILRAKTSGVMYESFAAAESLDPNESLELQIPIGLQPLPRPAEQYAWCYRLRGTSSLNTQPFVTYQRFVHDPVASTKLFDLFEGGKKLFPADPVSERARQIVQAQEHSSAAFQMAIENFKEPLDEESVLKELRRIGITIRNELPFSFTIAEKAALKTDWDGKRSDLSGRINWRRALYL